VLIVADSTAMPRDEVPYEGTWIYMVRQAFPDYEFIDRPGRGSTSMRLVLEGGGGKDLLEYYTPDMVILQVGMAECAPRLFRKTGLEHFLLNKVLPFGLRPAYVNHVKRKRVRNPKITDVSPERFRGNITAYFERARKLGVRVTALLIARPASLFIEKSPHIEANIELYNRIYRETAALFPNVEVIEPFGKEVDVNLICLDEIHISPAGARLIADNLKPSLDRLSAG